MADLATVPNGDLPPQVLDQSSEDPRVALVHRILTSSLFVKAPTLCRFLQYVCCQVFDGNAAQINEQLIGIQVFGREPGYDSNDDNIVRATASRLRSRLTQYFATEGVHEEWTVTIPRGSYIPQFTRNNTCSIAEEAAADQERNQNSFAPSALQAPIPLTHEPAPSPADTLVVSRQHYSVVQISLALLLAAALVGLGFGWRSALSRHRPQTAAPRHTPSTQARDLYLEGRFYWDKHNPDVIHQATVRFEQAIRLDPNYALPYAGLADCYAVTASGLPAPERWSLAKSYALRAVALDDSSAEAHTALAFILYKFEWNWTDAERHFRRALQLDPNNALAQHWFGEFLVLRGRSDEGLAHLRRALILQPLSLPIRNDLARALYRTRHYDQAITEARHVLALDSSYNAWATLVYPYEAKHDLADAVDADLHAAQIGGMAEAQRASLRRTFLTKGWQAYWTERVDLLRQSPPESVPAYVFAEDYLRIGNKDLALHFLEKSFDDRGDAPLLIASEPLFDPLRQDPRFIFLLKRAGFQ